MTFMLRGAALAGLKVRPTLSLCREGLFMRLCAELASQACAG